MTAIQSSGRILNDEPCADDLLDRQKLARALANVVERCDTPLVIGLYGTWGMGKTSLMRLVDHELTRDGEVVTVWFEAWQHQFDENPTIALLHTMVDELGLGEDARKLLHVIAGALGGLLMKRATTFSTTELRELSDRYDEERFLIREKQIRLRAHFAELLSRATRDGEVRLVFFVDDLDRCVPEQVLRVLEALKLFLNMPGCVYVLGVDRAALENSIRHRYQEIKVSEAEYLDKIVQLPFTIPPIASGAMHDFVAALLPPSLEEVVPDLVEALGENPRQVKRFVNSFLLNHELASALLEPDYRPSYLVGVLLLQYRKPELFKEAARDPGTLLRLGDASVNTDPWVEKLGERFQDAEPQALSRYVFLSEVAGVRQVNFDVVLTSVGEERNRVIAVASDATGLGWRHARILVAGVERGTPAVVVPNLARAEAERVVAEFQAIGADAELR